MGLAVVAIAVLLMSTILLISEIRNPADVVRVLLLGVSLGRRCGARGAARHPGSGAGARRAAHGKHHAIVKNLSSVETLGSASVIGSDKTGR